MIQVKNKHVQVTTPNSLVHRRSSLLSI